jgi:hypothetical protein
MQKAESQTHPSGSGHQNNTQARNKALTTIGQFALFAVLSGLTQSPFIIPRFLQVEFTINVFIAGECFFQVMTAFVLPIVFYLSCEDMRHYFKRGFWEKAPECLKIYNPDSQSEPARASRSQPKPAGISLSQPNLVQASQNQPEPAQTSPSQPEPARSSPSQPELAQASTSQHKPAQASTSQHKPAQASTSQHKPAQACPSKCG